MKLKPIRPGYYNPGIAQGFVRFGTGPHRILVYIHERGEATHADLREDLGLNDDVISCALVVLHRHGYIKRIGKIDPYKFGYTRRQYVYTMFWADGGVINKRYEAKRKTAAERQRKYYQNKKAEAKSVRVASVFDLGSV